MQKGPLTPEFRALIAECRFHDAFPNSLASVFAALFGQLEGEALAELEREFRWVQVAGGTPLFRKGDTGDDMYIVINGRLRVVIEDLNGAERVMEEVGRGGNVGELALLTGERRSATVCAVRDSDLLQLSKAAFERLLERYPRAMMQIVRTAAWRARRARQYPGREGSAATSFAVVPAGPDVPVGEFARRLTQALSPAGDTLRLAAADVDKLLGKPSAAQSVDDSVGHASLVAWLSEQERLNRFVILEADAGLTPWTRRCLRQADHVLVVGRAGANPAPGEIEAALGVLGLKARVELVLLHPDSTEWPSNTGAWLAPRRIHAHHHARLANNGDLRRLARRLTDRAVGLVLGGGGARGFVHIGAIRALEEEGVEIDFVGGTSMGSLIAAVYATHHTVEEMVELARSFSSRRKLLDPTLPLTALMAGRKVTRLPSRRSFLRCSATRARFCSTAA